MLHIAVQSNDFSVQDEYDRLRGSGTGAGAVVTFTGLVREFHGEQGDSESSVQELFLEHYPGMTEKALKKIVDQANARWTLLDCTVIHRIGSLAPGDQIVFVGTVSAHRGEAFDAARYIMDYLKTDAPFWKRQRSGQGTQWIESRESDREAVSDWKRSG